VNRNVSWVRIPRPPLLESLSLELVKSKVDKKSKSV